jgi:hypothetical protein
MKTVIEVKTNFFPLAFILFLCTPVIEINGQKNKRSWGTHFFEVKPGDYAVKIYFPYLFISECGANQVKIHVSEGETKKISFYMPPWMLMAGTIKVAQ